MIAVNIGNHQEVFGAKLHFLEKQKVRKYRKFFSLNLFFLEVNKLIDDEWNRDFWSWWAFNTVRLAWS